MVGAIERITLDMLTLTSVSVKKQQYVEVNDTEYPIGDPWRRAYTNSSSGRQQVQDEVPEPYRSAIFAVWGESPTVADPVGESPVEVPEEENESDAGSAE
jgi:hypothetical protein